MATRFDRKNPLTKVKCADGVTGPAGFAGVKLLRNALWQPNLVGRTLDQSVGH